MNKGISGVLMAVGGATIIVSGVLGAVFPMMYVGILLGALTTWAALPEAQNSKKIKNEESADFSFDGTATQTGMNM